MSLYILRLEAPTSPQEAVWCWVVIECEATQLSWKCCGDWESSDTYFLAVFKCLSSNKIRRTRDYRQVNLEPWKSERTNTGKPFQAHRRQESHQEQSTWIQQGDVLLDQLDKLYWVDWVPRLAVVLSTLTSVMLLMMSPIRSSQRSWCRVSTQWGWLNAHWMARTRVCWSVAQNLVGGQ